MLLRSDYALVAVRTGRNQPLRSHTSVVLAVARLRERHANRGFSGLTRSRLVARQTGLG